MGGLQLEERRSLVCVAQKGRRGNGNVGNELFRLVTWSVTVESEGAKKAISYHNTLLIATSS